MSLTFPLIAWGAADDISGAGWASVASPVVTGAQADPFGGTGAYKVDDTDAVNYAYRRKAVTFVDDGDQFFGCFLKGDTSTKTELDIFGAANRGGVTATWAGGVPTVAAVSGGTALPPVSVGNAWYFISGFAHGVIKSESHTFRLISAITTAGSTGAVIAYMVNCVLLHYPDNVVVWHEPRAGSSYGQSPGGVEDADTVGTDYRLNFAGCWIPPWPIDDPTISGAHGPNESIGINCGVNAMLRAGRDKQLLTIAKDRSNLAAQARTGCYLVEPMGGPPTPEPNWTMQRYALSFRHPSLSFGTYWP